jgi:hypothetical protein
MTVSRPSHRLRRTRAAATWGGPRHRASRVRHLRRAREAVGVDVGRRHSMQKSRVSKTDGTHPGMPFAVAVAMAKATRNRS